MLKSKFIKSIISFTLVSTLSLSMIFYGTPKVSAFDTSYLSQDGMELGYRIINGYSKLSAKNKLASYETSAVYSGLDVSSPYVITMVGLFYFTNGVDVDKAMEDNDYTMSLIKKLDSFLNKMGVKNDRAKTLKSELINSGAKILNSFDTAGLYIIKADNTYCKNLTENKNVYFVLAGGKMPPSMKDLNFDGKSDTLDGKLIQEYLVDRIEWEDKDEKEYIKFACDINGDKEITIIDTTELQK